VNAHLAKKGIRVNNLEDDFEDGLNLISLLEVLSQRPLGKPNLTPATRTHKLSNLSIAFRFLKEEGIYLVNVSSEGFVCVASLFDSILFFFFFALVIVFEQTYSSLYEPSPHLSLDILNKNTKLLLALIWTLILKYQIQSVVKGTKKRGFCFSSFFCFHFCLILTFLRLLLLHLLLLWDVVASLADMKKGVLAWCRSYLKEYNLAIDSFSNSFRDGLVFCAMVHKANPGIINFDECLAMKVNSTLCRLDVTSLLDSLTLCIS